MKIRLLDYEDKEFFCEIPDDTQEIVINVISGDMVLVNPIYFDTSKFRIMNFNDGTIILKREDFHKLNECSSSYDAILWNI